MKGIFGILFFICSACASIPTSLEKPQVNLQQVNVSNASLTDANLVFQVLVKNPNPVPVSVDKVHYALKLNGRPFTDGILQEGLKVGPNSSVVVPLPITVKYADLSQSLTEFLQQGTTKYQLNGSVKVGLFSIPFEQAGDLKLTDLGK